MLDNIKLRHNLIGIILLLYLLPMLSITAYGVSQSSWNMSWAILSIGLLLSSIGSLIFYCLLHQWESELRSSQPVEITETILSAPLETPAESEPESESAPQSERLEELESQLTHLNTEVEELQKNLEEALQTNHDHLEEINYRNQMIQQLTQEKKQFQIEAENIKRDFDSYRHISEETLEQEKILSIGHQETISELRSVVEQKQQQIEQLDNKIRDLTYEIKTLLQLADMESFTTAPTTAKVENSEQLHGFSVNKNAKNYLLDIEEEVEEYELAGNFIRSSEEAKIQLKRCIDIAQKITGSHHFGAQKSRFGDLYIDNYALDLRRLCDNLRSENSGTVLVYSPKDNKLLFINNQVKNLLGWSPEKFVQDFENIIQGGMFEWKSSISQLSTMNNAQSRLVMKSKSGEDKLLHCQLGLIPTGVFRNNIIGILYPA